MMTEAKISVRGLSTGYGRANVIRDIELEVHAGEIVTLLGPNGAGKSATLLALAGELPVRKGEIRLNGEIARGGLPARASRGLGYLPEGRSVFRRLSVESNLRLGSGPVERALELAPELKKLMARKAGLLSGGEQQLLCIARLLAAGPDIIMVDELSLGLAPVILTRLFALLVQAAKDGAAVLIVEQQATRALELADRAYVLSQGAIAHEGTAAELQADAELLDHLYFGALPAEAADTDAQKQ